MTFLLLRCWCLFCFPWSFWPSQHNQISDALRSLFVCLVSVPCLAAFLPAFLAGSQGYGQRDGKGWMATGHVALQQLSSCEPGGYMLQSTLMVLWASNRTGFCGFAFALLPKFQSPWWSMHLNPCASLSCYMVTKAFFWPSTPQLNSERTLISLTFPLAPKLQDMGWAVQGRSV